MRQITHCTFLITLALLVLVLSACQADTPPEIDPTATSVVAAAEPDSATTTSSSNSPTQTAPEPSPTLLVADFPLPIPQGQAATEWQGIPIMAAAINGNITDSGTYAFIIENSPAEIQAHYETLLPAKGWEHLISSSAQDGTVVMIFKKEAHTIKIAVFNFTEDLSYVLLTP